MKRWREKKMMLVQLSEVMECLEHISTKGCTNMGLYDMEIKRKLRSKLFSCQDLLGLI